MLVPLVDQLYKALADASVITSNIRSAPGEVSYLDRPDGGEIAFGPDDIDGAGQQWWIATVTDSSGDAVATINETDLKVFAEKIREWL